MTWGPMGRGGECPECKALTAERDRLAAENTELRADLVVVGGAFSHANATLDRLREAVPDGDWIYACSEIRLLRVIVAVRKLLYPKETDNGN